MDINIGEGETVFFDRSDSICRMGERNICRMGERNICRMGERGDFRRMGVCHLVKILCDI